MIPDILRAQIATGEDSRCQFKRDVTNADALAAEMAAFANADGGTLFLGVADDGSVPGLSRTDVNRINQIISNAASQHVKSPLTVQTKNIPVDGDRVVIILTVPKGQDKPYFDRNGVIWFKNGADKRRVNSREELRRLFQSVDIFHADELPTRAGVDKLDRLRFRDFLRDTYNQPYPDSPEELLTLLQNMNLAADNGMLNLAGVLLFAERPEWIKPQFIIKAIRYPGNGIHVSEYLDTEDFTGTFPDVFEGAMAFVMRNLRKIQAGKGVNAPGVPEIPPVVFEELLVNALVHRDYLISAPIRLFIFDDRIEIISPGHLPNNLTVEKIRAGNSNIRNPILASYVAKGLLPYRGLGSGIKRALEDWPEIDFTDDQEGDLFTVTVHRKEERSSEKGSQKSSPKGSQKSSQKIIELMQHDPTVTIAELARSVGVTDRAIKKQIEKLKQQGRLRRIGPARSGHWEVLE
ncbi:ATP-dependent DNA helicase RecG [Methanoculleus sediminis]|jgi:ATP-dependent DNA helicase RecG|uniref:ATP-dependent DNA helicase RecG n=1 Tax=Methanoculleus sediminis TaxID=1550566 RepID=A0A0H1QWC4_9EURY|nr:RNA-binding domain-containing protein [Methanoculleus sediminis]KLK87253.1 ATP-dependent DNA helicase RecG [Methanoculleus sediminis]